MGSTSVCQRLKEEHRGKWLYSVDRDRFACVFRPVWSGLGISKRDPIIGLGKPGEASSNYPRVHFRLVVDRSDTDAGAQFRYRLSLKVDARKEPALGKAVVRALRKVESMPHKEQFTKLLKSTSKLPGIGDEPDAVPDSVVDWFARRITKLVPALDSVFERRD